MQEINREILAAKAKEIFESGKADRLLGWKRGEFDWDVTPALFTAENLDGFVYNGFCGANFSK